MQANQTINVKGQSPLMEMEDNLLKLMLDLATFNAIERDSQKQITYLRKEIKKYVDLPNSTKKSVLERFKSYNIPYANLDGVYDFIKL